MAGLECPLFSPSWAATHTPEKHPNQQGRGGIYCPETLHQQAGTAGLTVVDSVTTGDCLVESFLVAAYSRKKIQWLVKTILWCVTVLMSEFIIIIIIIIKLINSVNKHAFANWGLLERHRGQQSNSQAPKSWSWEHSERWGWAGPKKIPA